VRDLLRTIGVWGTGLRVWAGDLMARRECPPDAVLSASAELVLHVADAADESAIPSACVRSGWCIEYCPTQVQPAALLEAAQRRDMTLAEEAGLHACIDCGICTYVCPSDLPLAAAIRTLRLDAHIGR
jgi:electron transport complex protein RnfC